MYSIEKKDREAKTLAWSIIYLFFPICALKFKSVPLNHETLVEIRHVKLLYIIEGLFTLLYNVYYIVMQIGDRGVPGPPEIVYGSRQDRRPQISIYQY